MSQLAEMGVSIPQEYRADMSLVGEWQTLSETKVAAEGLEGAGKSIGVRKRKHEGDEEQEEVDDHAPGKTTSLGWGSKLRTYPGEQEEEDGDLDALLSSNKELKRSKNTPADTEFKEIKLETPALATQEDAVPESAAPEAEKSSDVKTETSGVESEAPKDERPPNEEVTGFSFKKRKPKVMRK